MKNFFITITTCIVIAGLSLLVFSMNNSNAEPKKVDVHKQSQQASAETIDNSSNESDTTTDSQEFNSKNSGEITKVESFADMEIFYSSVEDLTLDADVIIEGNVLQIDYFDYKTNTFTKSQVEVVKSYNDAVKKGDILTFIEIGGITTKGALAQYDPEKIKVTSEDKNDPVQVTFNGTPVMKKNEKVLIFGVKSKDKIYLNGEDYYLPLGTYQGKFNISQGKVKRFVSEHDKGSKYTSLEMAIEQMTEKIQKAKKK